MLRLIAFITMVIDHVGFVFFPGEIILRIIGRIAFPIFAYSLAKGYERTRDVKKYAIRLFIIAIISQVPYSFLFHVKYLNICFELLLGLLTLFAIDKLKDKWKQVGVISLALALSEILHLEYGMYGILMVLIFSIKNKPIHVFAWFLALSLAGTYIFKMHPIQAYSIIGTVSILLLNKFDFKLPKWINYGFYPIHLVILLLIEKFI